MFAIYDLLNDGYVSSIDHQGCCIGFPGILFDTEELAEACLIWLCAWLDDDEENYDVVFLDELLDKH